MFAVSAVVVVRLCLCSFFFTSLPHLSIIISIYFLSIIIFISISMFLRATFLQQTAAAEKLRAGVMAIRQRKERSIDATARFRASLEQKIRHLQRLIADVDGRRQKLASACTTEEQRLKRCCVIDIREYQRQANADLEQRFAKASKREGWESLFE